MTRQGQIVRWDAARGFGFIATPEGARNIFFHVRDFRGGEPAEGMSVRFEQIEVGGKGRVVVLRWALAGSDERTEKKVLFVSRAPTMVTAALAAFTEWFNEYNTGVTHEKND